MLLWRLLENLNDEKNLSKFFVEFWVRFRSEFVFSDILLGKRWNVIGGNWGILLLLILFLVRLDEKI